MILFSSCKARNADKVLWEGESYLVYPMEITSSGSLSVDDDGNLYYMENPYDNPKLEKPLLHKVDMNGNIVKSYIINEKDGIFIPNIVYDNKLYYLKKYIKSEDEHDNMTIILFEYDIDTDNIQQIYEFQNYSNIKKFEVYGNDLYFLGYDNSKRSSEDEITFDKDEYIYEGEVLGVISIDDKSMKELDIIDCPVIFDVTEKGNLLVYGYDKDDGYYFTEYNINDNSCTDRVYHNLGKLDDLEIFNDNNDFMIKRMGKLLLEASSLKKSSGVTELMPNVSVGRDGVVCKGGYTFYYNFLTKRIERIKTANYIKFNKTINMVYTKYFTMNPFGCGYDINKQQIDEESFVISALSQDTSHDLYLMDSRQDISENIRNKGAFYALNDVEGVMEYLDACFPYIKEAAINEDGDVWMLPIVIDVPCLIYNERLCKDYSIDDISKPLDYESFVDLLHKLRNDSKLRDKISIAGYALNQNAIYQYLREFNNFNQILFRDLAVNMKDKVNYVINQNEWTMNMDLLKKLNIEDNYDFIFINEATYEYQSKIYSDELRVSQMPILAENDSSVAICTYLCVNPASKQLDDTLAYISSLCDYLMEYGNTMLFKERGLYPDNKYYDSLYSVYSNAEISFTVPTDVYYSDYIRYLNDEISLEDFIKTADHKLDMYRNE
jgi:hypothetical protein